MAIVYNKSGALTELLRKVNDQRIKTFKDVVEFLKNFEGEKKKILDTYRTEVETSIPEMRMGISDLIIESGKIKKQEENRLNNEVKELESLVFNSAEKNPIYSLINRIKKRYYAYRLDELRSNFDNKIQASTEAILGRIDRLKEELDYTEHNVEDIARDRARVVLTRFEYINSALNENKFLIYGAEGELKAIKELKALPDTYHVINNYIRHFNPPVYNREKFDRISSTQIDHLVIGPTGLFVVETKNWSKKSVESTDLFSPVEQVKRAGFALFVFLNEAIRQGEIANLVHNWGGRKISPKQIIALIGSAPYSDFQFVKVIAIDQLAYYIKSGKDEFSREEVADITRYLLNTGEG